VQTWIVFVEGMLFSFISSLRHHFFASPFKVKEFKQCDATSMNNMMTRFRSNLHPLIRGLKPVMDSSSCHSAFWVFVSF